MKIEGGNPINLPIRNPKIDSMNVSFSGIVSNLIDEMEDRSSVNIDLKVNPILDAECSKDRNDQRGYLIMQKQVEEAYKNTLNVYIPAREQAVRAYSGINSQLGKFVDKEA